MTNQRYMELVSSPAFIQTSELIDKVERLTDENESLRNGGHFTALEMAKIACLGTENARLRAELEAAKKDMWFMRTCLNCVHCPPDYPALHGACVGCDDEDEWEWRGVPANTPAQGATDETTGGEEK